MNRRMSGLLLAAALACLPAAIMSCEDAESPRPRETEPTDPQPSGQAAPASCAILAAVLDQFDLFDVPGSLIVVSETVSDPASERLSWAEQRVSDLRQGKPPQSASRCPVSCSDPEAEQSRLEVAAVNQEMLDEFDKHAEERLIEMRRDLERQSEAASARVDRLTPDLQAAFIAANAGAPADLDTCSFGSRVEFLEPCEHAAIFGCGWWEDFYRRYPDSAGITTLSRPALAADGSTALVYVARKWGGLAGEGHWVVLRRAPEGWVVHDHIRLWIS